MSNKNSIQLVTITLVFFSTMYSCTKDQASDLNQNKGTIDTTSVIESHYKKSVTISINDGYINLSSNGTPDHVSPYWGVGNPLYEEQMNGSTLNPGKIATQNYSMTITAFPIETTNKEPTSLGPIGMALNGVPIYNDREGGNVPVNAGVLGSFDRAGAHPGPGNTYHYHCTGDFTGNDDSNLIGFLRDGFPIYARKDADGTYPSDLDSNGGHIGITADFTEPIYHYHASNNAYLGSRFYILKAGSYHGDKGTFTQ